MTAAQVRSRAWRIPSSSGCALNAVFLLVLFHCLLVFFLFDAHTE